MSSELKNVDATLPAHLQSPEMVGAGLEDMADAIRPPRLAIVGGNTQEPLRSMFPHGTVCAVPANLKVCDADSSFLFTPIAAYREYVLENPYQVKAKHNLPFARERTRDKNTELAEKCRNRESIPCPEDNKFDCKYMTHINILALLHESELGIIPCIIGFRSTGYPDGANALTLMMARNVKMYGCVFEAHPYEKSNEINTWWGLQVSNPATASPWVDEATFKIAEGYAKQFASMPSQFDLDASSEAAAESVSSVSEDDDF